MTDLKQQNHVSSAVKYQNSRWVQANEVAAKMFDMARKVYRRRGVSEMPDYGAYRLVAYQLHVSNYLRIVAPTVSLDDIPDVVNPKESYLFRIKLEVDNKPEMFVTFRFGPEVDSILWRIQLVEPDGILTGISQYYRWELSETLLAFFDVLEQSGFVKVAVVDDQGHAWSWIPRLDER